MELLSFAVIGDRRAKAKRYKAHIVVSSLVDAILAGKNELVFFTSDRGKWNKNLPLGHTAYLNIRDDLIQNGHLILVSDPMAAPVDNPAPRYRPSDELLALIPEEELEFEVLTAELEGRPLKDITYKPIKFTKRRRSKSEQANRLYFRYAKSSEAEWLAVKEDVIKLRQGMAKHEYDGLQVNGRSTRLEPLQRQFKGCIKNYGRYISSYQGMSNKTRLDKIRIDGQVCGEVDIVASIPSVLFGIYVNKNNLPDRDCSEYYADVASLVPALTREAVKAISNASIGTGGLNKVRYSDKFKTDFPEIVSKAPWKEVRSAMLEAMPQVELLKPRHIDWAYLNYLESEVLRLTREKLQALGVGFLPLHDALIVPVESMIVAKETFSQTFYQQLGVWPLIKTSGT
ncbi:hypothetical protein N8146_03965 [Ascidiaceihabitans sp.]|nr:hypothetical protein [Ascidiaceihabitans sp.]